MDLIDNSNKVYNKELNLKKINAVINFSQASDSFKDWNALIFLTQLLSEESLDAEGERFLDHILAKYSINYLDWCYKSLWVKKNIKSYKKNRRLFSFEQMKERLLVEGVQAQFPPLMIKHTITQLDMFAQ